MAQIISVIVESDHGGNDRRITYSVTLEDNQGVQTVVKHGPVVADASFDASAHAVKVGLQKLASMEEGEEIEVEDRLQKGIFTLESVTSAKWSTAKKIAKRLIRYMMRERDPRIVIALEPLIQYLQANYTAAQIATWLGITHAQVLKVNRRVNAILSDTGNVKNLLTAFDAEREEID